ncbi:MAG: hypothetical protein IKU46_04960 [Peptococcaceae bacterium]|nr:hypothetical protein [Peptococcaceae bacterium]
MAKRIKKLISVILTMAILVTTASPVFADTAINESGNNELVIRQALSNASEQEKESINAAVSYLEEKDILSIGDLVAIEMKETNSRTVEHEIVYTIDYDEFTEKIIFTEISDEKVSYTVTQGDITNTVTTFNDGRFLLNGHGIEVCRNTIENDVVSVYNTATNKTNLVRGSEVNSAVTPYAVDISYTTTCPYQTTRDYTYLAFENEQPNVLLYEVFKELTLTAFTEIISRVYPAAGVVISIAETLYDFIGDTAPETEGLSYLEENYYHKTCDAMSAGYIDALGYSVTKIVTHWFARPYYAGDWHTTTVYKEYVRW